MAIKKQILSWLRGFKSEEEPEEHAEDEQLKAGQTEEAIVEPEPEPVIVQLDLPREHALHQIFDLWTRQSGWRPSPKLRLEDPGILPPNWGEKELARLKNAITTAANAHLTKSKPKDRPKPQAKGPDGKEPPPPPPPSVDASPWVFMTLDRLAAWMIIFPPIGEGRELDKEMLDKCLKDNELTFGVNEELLSRLPAERGKYLNFFLVAKGTPAVNGKDGHIVDFFARVLEHEVKVDEFGQVDYTTLNLVQNADKGDAICQMIPHTEGEPGTTVQGKEIPAKPGKKVTLPKGRNTETNEDGTKLLASQSGHVEFSGRAFQVKPVLDIGGNVDYSTGNINFRGDVHIRGDVCVGFFVRAVGNIRVDGVVEGSVEAGGDLLVAKGILGSQQAVIRAHRNIFAKYIENSSVHARENLQADSLVNCEVYSDGVVQVNSGRGTIIGGKVCAADGITAKIVGSKSESLTTIVLGGLPCSEYERELLLHEIEELERLKEKTERQPDGPVKLSKLSKTRMQISVNRMKLDQMDKDLAAMRKEMEESEEPRGKARLECGIAYPNTEIMIGKTTLRLTQETHKCVARLTDSGEIRVL